MSKVINDSGVRAGCIYRIALENFVTYKQVELYPNLSLNLIIGPNGTGKSTFVCAIILGLCGKTSVIGRAKKISEYVRSGCEQATIEIELYQQPGQHNVIITRSFNLKDVSTWAIDHKSAREKQVQDLIASLNVQVDNLCQLLPQDRVQDFSKMDAQELLRSTLSAVGGRCNVTQLDTLIDYRSQQRGLSTKLQNNAQLMEEQIRLNERLKVVIDAMKQRKEMEKQIEICEKKKLWLEYQELRDKVVEYTTDRKNAVKLVDSLKNKMEPLEKFMATAKTEITKLEQEKLRANKDIHVLQDNIRDNLAAVRTQEYTLKDIEASLTEMLERHRNKELELEQAKFVLEKITTDRDKLIEKVGDEDKVNMKKAELQKPIAKTNAAMEAVKKEKLKVQFDLENNITPQIRLYQNRIRNLEDVGVKRLEALRAYSEDSYKAVLWLRENRDMFQHPVYEPMMLEITFTEAQFARYLESTVPARDLAAFTFESSSDMNRFMQSVRAVGLKRVNAICSQPAPVLTPHTHIQKLSYLGFHTYLLDTVSAPAAILSYLCAQYGIHRIPIGDAHTYNNSGSVPANITYFFTENHKFTVRVSAYSGVKSSSTVEIRPARLLANIVDVEQLANYNTQLSNFEKQAQSHRDKMQDLDNKLSTLEEHLNHFKTSLKQIIEDVERVRAISVKFRLQKKKVQDIENECVLDVVRERERARARQVECVRKQCRLHAELNSAVRELHALVHSGHLCKVKLEYQRNSIVEQESELRALRGELNSFQATVENITIMLTRAKSNAKEKLMEAKSTCNNMLPHETNFPYKEDFAVLPSDLNSLQEHSYQLQTRMECMEQGDANVLKEYEERERMIEKLKSEVSNSSGMHKEFETKMAELRSEWLPPLEALLQEMDKTFGDMFAKLGCAGEIKLEKSGGEDEYDKYGVCILVRFRAGEQLQPLTRHTQSGGERALCTALYLMALQRLTTVPFRCVDEINQGMDAINERKMFQLLVQVTTQCDNAQYFLLTPKLLTNMEYNSNIMVHTIMNGKDIMNYRNWKYHKFLERAYQYRP